MDLATLVGMLGAIGFIVMAMILGTCSMVTGQTSSQARQVVHAHNESSAITSPSVRTSFIAGCVS